MALSSNGGAFTSRRPTVTSSLMAGAFDSIVPGESRFRPAIDPLFRTAADHYASQAIGAILSGHLSDGAHGLMVIQQSGARHWCRTRQRQKHRKCR